ncbi:S9 family peptidase [Paenibacillus sp. IB182496]|uniref:S9 family peptidase n=1 Tax=Paenibacillus sabuli TaxID=2772509 RepID=A0A927BT28_9BACL|nr:S9 family peptidase [Paenibacillus sabuli]MBD2845391.1 S9 family peptidase [Paenibacillus sabuli]
MRAAKARIVPETLARYVWPADPAVRPGADEVAYTRRTIRLEQDGYRTEIRRMTLGGERDEPFTGGDQDTNPVWSPDGLQLAFHRPVEGKKQIFTIAAGGGEPVQRTAAARGAGSFAWSPDSRMLVFAAKTGSGEPGETPAQPADDAAAVQEAGQTAGASAMAGPGRVYDRTVPKAEGAGLWDGLYTHLFLYELETGHTRRLTRGRYDASAPSWLPTGRAVAFLAKRVEDKTVDPDLHLFNDLFAVAVDGGEAERLTDSTLLISQYACAPDASGYALLADDRSIGSGTMSRIYAVRFGDPRPAAVTAASDIQYGNWALSDMKTGAAQPGPVYAPDGRTLYVLGTLHGGVHLYRIPLEGAWPVQPIPLTAGKKDIFQLACTADGVGAVFAAMEDGRPQELYRMDLRSGEEARLTACNDALMEELEVSPPQCLWLDTSDGYRMQGWFVEPPGLARDERVPLALVVHGGPHAMYTGRYSHEMQTLAAAGMAVLYVNPRGSFGYGQPFAAACRGDFGGGDARDLLEAVEWAIRAFPCIDPSRVGVAGGSYGGLMTNWLVARTERFRAAVSQRCISNWLSFYGLSDIGLTYTEGIAGGNPWDDQALLWERSPLAHARKVEAPILIMHGEQDMRCPIDQADQWYVALKRHGKTARLIRYPGGHAFMKAGKPSVRIDALRQTNDWLAHYLQADVRLDAAAADASSAADAAVPARVQLPLPVGLLIENCRTSGLDDATIMACIASVDFSALASKCKAPDMDFADRARLAEEMGLPWRQAMREGYSFGFLHLNGLKRLLLFRFGREEGRDYAPSEQGPGVRDLPLTRLEALALRRLVCRQWDVVLSGETQHPDPARFDVKLRTDSLS